MTDEQPLLEIDGLHTRFDSREGTVHAVNGVSFTVGEGEIVGIVGESGSGKSVTALSAMRLEDPGEITAGSIEFRDTELTTADDRTLRRMRGRGMAMVFQDPMSTLNPVFRMSEQIAESLKVHDDPDDQRLMDYLRIPPFSSRSDWADKRQRAIELMGEVGIPHPEERADAYPHEFSGGMRQRAMLAIALAREPDLLIADEPTTALDVTIQAQILDLIQTLNAELGMGVLLITHDMGVIAELCDRVIVLYGGEVMESGTAERILTEPRHPYTRALLKCMPQTTPRRSRLFAIDGQVPDLLGEASGCVFATRCEYATEECRNGEMPTVALSDDHRAKCCRLDAVDDDPRRRTERATSGGAPPPAASPPEGSPIIELEDVSKQFALDDSLVARLLDEETRLQAVSDVSLTLHEGETLGLVGESGSGKSTLAHLIAGLYEPTSGEIRFDGEPVGEVTDRPTELLADMGMVFQNPRGSLSPRLTVRSVLAEPLTTQGWSTERQSTRVRELIDLVDLSEIHLDRYPHELSGGQIQRVAIARALALDPRVLVLDEPVSALDVSVQAKILNLLMDLQAGLDLTYLFIAHDLSVVEHIADRVAVMYLGNIVETAPSEQLFETPAHPYTEALLSAVPSVDPRADTEDRIILEGDVPSPVDPPSGCAFHPRCPRAEPECAVTDPEETEAAAGLSACLFADNVFGSPDEEALRPPERE